MFLMAVALALAVAQQPGPARPAPRFHASAPELAALSSVGQVPASSDTPVARSSRPASSDTPVARSSLPVAADTALPRAAGSPPSDTVLPRPGASLRADAGAAREAGPARPDTPVARPRPRAVEYSDWYGRRLAVHRVASYTLLPLLGLQYYTGTQLMAKGSAAPDWVIRAHGPLATASAVVFGLNTVTGVWNLWEARRDPNGRAARTAHGLLMLLADGGFLAAGSMGHKAVQDGSTRTLHRTIALSSMGVALVSYAIMLPPFRR